MEVFDNAKILNNSIEIFLVEAPAWILLNVTKLVINNYLQNRSLCFGCRVSFSDFNLAKNKIGQLLDFIVPRKSVQRKTLGYTTQLKKQAASKAFDVAQFWLFFAKFKKRVGTYLGSIPLLNTRRFYHIHVLQSGHLAEGQRMRQRLRPRKSRPKGKQILDEATLIGGCGNV
jgi:hypothetical protein